MKLSIHKHSLGMCFVMIAFTPITMASDNVFTETANGIEWTYHVVDGEAVLGGNNEERTISTSTFGAICIPERLGGYVVTGIGACAFRDCTALTLVTIPNTVKQIFQQAFRDCSGLMAMNIPDGVVSIGNGAFYWCRNISRITIPDSVVEIGMEAFRGCGNLRYVNIPKNLTIISDRTFQDCPYPSIDIPYGVRRIGGMAFSWGGCGSEHISIPYSVVEIGGAAFSYGGVRHVIIPGSVKDIGSELFDAGSVTNAILESGVPYISANMFSRTPLENIDIADTVSIIGSSAFASCVKLRNPRLPSSLTTIGNYAFQSCTAITEMTIPTNVQIVGGYAFKDCTNLKSVKFLGNAPIADTITFENVNADCTAYVRRSSTGWNVDIPGEWMGIKIAYFDPAIYTVVLDANGGSLGEAAGEVAFGEGEVMCSLPVPERESYAFLGWYTDAEGGTRVAEGSVVTANMTLYAHWQEAVPVLTIEDGMLVDVSLNGGTRIEIPDGVKVIADDAFANCAGLESVSIPNSVTSMTFAAFSRCDKLWTKWYRALANGVMPNAVDLTVTNVVVHYVTQSMPSAAVVPPIAAGIVNVVSEVNAGAAVAITADWAAQYPGFEAKFGNDSTKAITAETGKRDGAGKPMMVWQDFVAGTDPTNPDDVFKASITFDAVTGNPIVSWTPELSAAEAAKRAYKTFGKVRLNDPDWTLIDGDAANYNFFKVTVQMK